MSGTLTLTVGQVFTGGTSLSGGDTGMIALTEVGTELAMTGNYWRDNTQAAMQAA